ncbi:MAG: phosphonate ABC transporter ATP-binding protein [Actinobacteria bacterium]|jgi:phosphonate transport system ATP-binding protein|nr:phosphonate ABC transporter ATP-binding protein [Acidimicrobiia bacterium]NCX30976.1 phosphonate ABC transporter ATP-binding protein [Actinomycetota bacterium]NCV96933.1 phosphonate ABC transporter ATP-binding protein [Acidimicrobiia bacterium]NCX17159.1 phosphonate ABC transporter ATP-binding protein [Acidimicrobiia bacterium]NCX59767.1 phosphonate ABC transporter ATP-binding protein [Actinomycetota bacterium]
MTTVLSGGADPLISLTGVSKRFPNGTLALDNVSMTVPKGQLLSLIGLSGSGKSTLMRHLNGLHKPTAGTVKVFGVEVSSASSKQLRDVRRNVGFVFQQFGLVGRATCLENVLSGALGRLRGPRYGVWSYPRTLRREAFDHLERVGLAPQAYQRADTLSGGQMQRVAIARTIMQQPQLLLADEPVASLDPESSAQVLELLLKVATEDKMTVIVTLHQVELALGWAHRIVGLRDGRVVLDQDARGLSQTDVMEVYRRVDRESELLATPSTPAAAPITERQRA